MNMKESYYRSNIRSKRIKANSNPGRSFVPMVVFVASGLISWRYFIFNPVSNRIKNRRTAPSGSYSPMVDKKTNPVSELENILPVLNNYTLPESIVNKEQSKYLVPFFIGRWYHL